MRNLILFLLGVAVGVLGAVNVVNALRQRDAYPRGLMDVMQHHEAMLRQNVRLNRCDAKTTTAALNHLQELAKDIESAFDAEGADDAPFREYAQRLRDTLAASSSAADCPALASSVNKIGAACDACHRQFR
jgi:cytochrome c556